jgi:hypothetical protein
VAETTANTAKRLVKAVKKKNVRIEIISVLLYD